MNVKKLAVVGAFALVVTSPLAGIAIAAEGDEGTESTMVTPQVIVDEENGVIYVGLPVDGELPECAPADPGDPSGGMAGDSDDGATTTYGPGDCIEIVINHPSGKTHHGAIVSSVAKSLHPSMLAGIKKGEIMRWVAKTGKVDSGDGDTKPEKVDKSRAKADKFRGKADKFRAKADWFESRGGKFKDKAEKFRDKADKFEAKANGKNG